MKALIVLIVVLAGVWLWRSGRRAPPAAGNPGRTGRRSGPTAIEDMTCCPVCGVHLPREEAVEGKVALYCSADHRRQAEG